MRFRKLLEYAILGVCVVFCSAIYFAFSYSLFLGLPFNMGDLILIVKVGLALVFAVILIGSVTEFLGRMSN